MKLQFQMRPKDGRQHVYLVSVDGVPVPAGNQSAVYSNASASRAQVICDELNRGILDRIGEVAQRAKAVQAQSQARRRMEGRA